MVISSHSSFRVLFDKTASVYIWKQQPFTTTIGGGAGGHRRTGVGGTMHSGPTLTPVDRNKTYCFHELVLNLPAPLDIQWPKCFQLQRGFAPWPPDQGLCPWTLLGALSPDPRYRLMLRTRHGAPQPLTPSAAYGERGSTCRKECSLRYGSLLPWVFV